MAGNPVPQTQPPPSAAATSATQPSPPDSEFPQEGHYDPCIGAAAYAQIIGAFGALAVPSFIFLFDAPHNNLNLLLTTGLLVIELLGGLFGALGLAAIGAERDPTANLAAAVMYLAIPAALSIVATVGAFQVVIASNEPRADVLFSLIVAAGGIFAVAFTAFAIADSSGLGPTNPATKLAWIKAIKPWIRDRETGYRWTWITTAIAIVPIFAGLALRWSGVRLQATVLATDFLIGAGIALTMVGIVAGLLRTAHSDTNAQKPLRSGEAFTATLTISGYCLLLLLYLP